MNNRRLATPGAVLLVVGVVLMWWGSAIFRGDSKPTKAIGGTIPKGGNDDQDSPTPTGGSGSNVRTM